MERDGKAAAVAVEFNFEADFRFLVLLDFAEVVGITS